MKVIKKGEHDIVVDDDVYNNVSSYVWSIMKSGHVYRREGNSRTGCVSIFLHRFILGVHFDKFEYDVDHKNGNPLDNRRCNLRLVLHIDNCANQVKRKGGSSRHKGVYWNKAKRKWQAQITRNYRTYNLGRYDDEQDAARAYNEAAIELFGEYACLNSL